MHRTAERTQSAGTAGTNTTRAILAAAFGPDSPNIGAVLSAGRHNQMYPHNTPEAVIEAHGRENLRDAANMLDSCIEQLQLLAPIAEPAEAAARRPGNDNSVFIVHGSDEGKKEAVARFISTLELAPVILHEQANLGRTLIEKFEAHADVSFAVVILTGDDSGSSNAHPEAVHLRGQQNVSSWATSLVAWAEKSLHAIWGGSRASVRLQRHRLCASRCRWDMELFKCFKGCRSAREGRVLAADLEATRRRSRYGTSCLSRAFQKAQV